MAERAQQSAGSKLRSTASGEILVCTPKNVATREKTNEQTHYLFRYADRVYESSNLRYLAGLVV